MAEEGHHIQSSVMFISVQQFVNQQMIYNQFQWKRGKNSSLGGSVWHILQLNELI